MTIKILCRETNVEKVEAGPKGIVMHFRDRSFANPAKLAGYIADQRSFAKVRPDMSVVFIRDLATVAERLKETTAILRDLVKLITRKKAA